MEVNHLNILPMCKHQVLKISFPYNLDDLVLADVIRQSSVFLRQEANTSTITQSRQPAQTLSPRHEQQDSPAKSYLFMTNCQLMSIIIMLAIIILFNGLSYFFPKEYDKFVDAVVRFSKWFVSWLMNMKYKIFRH